MIATFQQHANLFAALHPAPDQPHETLDAAAAALPTVGSIVSVPKLGLRSVKVVEVVPSQHPLGEARYRVEWLGGRGATVGANFLAEDLWWGEGE